MNNLFLRIAMEIWMMLVMAGPYILFGFLMAGLIHTFIPPAKIVSLLGQRSWKSVFMASLCGVPLPLCSCSVLPTAATLREKGASRGATTSFLISTPEIGVDSIALTYGIMDLTMAVLRPLAAFVTALIAGVCVNIWGDEEANEPSTAAAPSSCCCSKTSSSTHGGHSVSEIRPSWWKKTLHYAFWELSDNLSHWLALGLFLSGIIAACIPDAVFSGFGQGVFSLVFMLIISVAMYICASGSTPIAAVMIAKGLSPGAALVFLLAGPATNIGSIPVLIKILGRRATVIYLTSIGLVTLLIGYSVNFYYANQSIVPQMAIHEGMKESPGALGIFSAFLLLVLLVKGMAFRPVPAEWRKLNDHLAGISGFRLTWGISLIGFVILAVLSFLLP